MNSVEKQAVLHCLKAMIDEAVCEECSLYGTTGTDHCEKDCVRLAINALSSSEKPKIGHCKDCKYFEYDSVAKVNGIPLIIAHEICKRWSDGCKTSEDGYCFLFEPQESEDKE